MITPQGNNIPKDDAEWSEMILKWNDHVVKFQNENRVNVQVMRALLVHTICKQGIIAADCNQRPRKVEYDDILFQIENCFQAANAAMAKNQLDVLLDQMNKTK